MTIRHIMVDIETMGTSPNSAILSIGATDFDPMEVEFDNMPHFYREIDLQSCIDAGLKMDASTVLWWMGQENAARLPLAQVNLEGLHQVMRTFHNYVQPSMLRKPVRIWCHGANFDAVLLEQGFKACRIDVPWGYNEVRCTRTIYEAGGVTLDDVKRRGTKHNARDDARHQALVVQLAYRRLDLRGTHRPDMVDSI